MCIGLKHKAFPWILRCVANVKVIFQRFKHCRMNIVHNDFYGFLVAKASRHLSHGYLHRVNGNKHTDVFL